jgi:phosphoserine phosphatase RsbU/P
LTESMNPQEEEYGDHRFIQFVKKRFQLNPDEFHGVFFEELKVFSQGAPQRDDVTLLSLQFS